MSTFVQMASSLLKSMSDEAFCPGMIMTGTPHYSNRLYSDRRPGMMIGTQAHQGKKIVLVLVPGLYWGPLGVISNNSLEKHFYLFSSEKVFFCFYKNNVSTIVGGWSSWGG